MSAYDFVEVIPADPAVANGYWSVVEGPDGIPEIIDNCFDTPEEAEQAGRGHKDAYYAESQQQAREAAFQIGMAAGCDAYNDFLGY